MLQPSQFGESMPDLENPKLIYSKGFLFLVGGILASGLLIWEQPTIKIVILLIIAIWFFARFYYFAFYVIEHYVDPSFRFAGLWSFARYLVTKRKKKQNEDKERC